MSRRLRWLLITVVAVLVILAGIAIGSWVVLERYGPHLAKERIEDALTRALDRPVTVGEVVLQPWVGRLQVLNVEVEPDRSVSEEPLLRLGRGQVGIGVSSLWRRELVISRILLEDLALNLIASHPSDRPFALDLPERFKLGPLTVQVKTIQVQRGRLRYQDRSEQLVLECQGVEALARPLNRGIDVMVQVAAFRLQALKIREEFTQIRAAGWIHQQRASLRSLTARWHEGEAHVSGEVRQPFDTPEFHLKVRGDLELAEIAKRAQVPFVLTGTATVDTAVDGRLGALRVAGRGRVPNLAAGPLRVTEVMVEGRWEDRQLGLSSIRARVFDGELRGAFATRLDRLSETRTAFTLLRAKLSQVEALASEPLGLRGVVDVEAALEGDPSRLAAIIGRLRLGGREIGLPGDLSRLGAGTVALHGTIRDGTLELSRTSGAWPGVRIEASGPVRFEGPQRVRVTLDADLGRILPLWSVRQFDGQAQLTGVLTGRWNNPQMSGQARAPVVTIARTRVEGLEVPFRIADRILTLSSANGLLGQTRIGATGHFTWRLDGNRQVAIPNDEIPFHAEVRVPSGRLEDLDPWLPPDWQGTGRFALTGQLLGTLAAWHGSGTVEAADLTLRSGVPIRTLRSTFTLDAQRFDLAWFQATVRGVPIRGTGGWQWDGTGRATAELGPLELGTIPEVPPGASLRGTGRARIDLTTVPGRIQVVGTGSVERTEIFNVPLGSGSLQVALHDGTLQANLSFPEARLTASARGRTGRDEPLSVRAEVKALELAPIFRRIRATGGARIEGTVSAAAELTVPIRRLTDTEGTLRLDPLRLAVEDETWTNQGPIVLHWTTGGFLIEQFQIAGRLGNARAAGRLEPSGALDLEVAGQIPLGVLPALRPEVRTAGGLLVLTARATGTTTNPRITGEATIRDGTLQLAGHPETFRDLTGRILISTDGLRLVEATTVVGRGRLRASGEMTLDGWRPGVFRFSLMGREVGVTPFEGLRTAWDADLELVGQGDKAQLRGEARLLQGTYAGQLSLLSLILSEREERPTAPAFALPLRILLRLNHNLRVETNLAKLRIGGTVSLEGTTTDPILFGTLESREGRITFRKNRYDVIAAAIRFTDPRKIDPILDITARARIKEYDVTVRLTGRPEDLSVRLSSTPALDEEGLLLLTTLGLTKEEAGQSPGGIAASQIAQLLLEELVSPEAGEYGLDVLEVEKVKTGQQDQTTVRVGKRVTEELRILYAQSIAGASRRILRVEYQVLGPLFLAGEQDFQGGVGGDVLLRLRFR
ncbi:MAG TPA: translocation/assembly module TamB domain-containing protein [Candidatus Methylomirabilis sp.]|nr:translocation/assembly module TamB domain-containing protein [Candidatus Methylomirabilis sp.]